MSIQYHTGIHVAIELKYRNDPDHGTKLLTTKQESLVARNVELTVGSNHADPNRLALTFRVLQPCLLRVFLFLEELRQGRKLAVDRRT